MLLTLLLRYPCVPPKKANLIIIQGGLHVTRMIKKELGCSSSSLLKLHPKNFNTHAKFTYA